MELCVFPPLPFKDFPPLRESVRDYECEYEYLLESFSLLYVIFSSIALPLTELTSSVLLPHICSTSLSMFDIMEICLGLDSAGYTLICSVADSLIQWNDCNVFSH